jgi:putative tricarboxylic transport membrane protein
MNSLLAGFLAYSHQIVVMSTDPKMILILFASVIMGILFGALPGLTATLGVALLTTLTYSLSPTYAIGSLLAIYVGAVYGGSYASITINIPGTPAGAATALDGYQMGLKGESGKALGIVTTASAIGTIVGTLFVLIFSPIILKIALQFSSWEYFLLALFGILICGTLAVPDLVMKGWMAGIFGIFISLIGRDVIQFFPRFTLGFAELESGIPVVPVLLGAFGIPQVIDSLANPYKNLQVKKVSKVLPHWGIIGKNMINICRSALMGVGIGSIPGVGEDVAAWVSYGAAKKSSKTPEKFGTGHPEAVIAPEVANNACIGGALIPLLTLGIPGSPPAAMLLGALMIHDVIPGPTLVIEHPTFLFEVSAVLFLTSIIMWICGMLLAKQFVKVLRIPSQIFMPIVSLFCIIGSYSLVGNVFVLYLMVITGAISYFMGKLGYPVGPMVIGVILGTMLDQNIRRALMLSQGSLNPILDRPVALIFVGLTVWLFLTQIPAVSRLQDRIIKKLKKQEA